MHHFPYLETWLWDLCSEIALCSTFLLDLFCHFLLAHFLLPASISVGSDMSHLQISRSSLSRMDTNIHNSSQGRGKFPPADRFYKSLSPGPCATNNSQMASPHGVLPHFVSGKHANSLFLPCFETLTLPTAHTHAFGCPAFHIPGWQLESATSELLHKLMSC